jgi:hypothetical protein
MEVRAFSGTNKGRDRLGRVQRYIRARSYARGVTADIPRKRYQASVPFTV